MILSICADPYISNNIEVESLTVGMKHKILSRTTYYIGKALNVSIGLSRLGVPVTATGFMGEENGRLFELELHKEGVPYKFVWHEGRVKEIYKFIDQKSMLTEVYEEGTEIPQEKQRELLQMINGFSPVTDGVVISGRLPLGIPSDYYQSVFRSLPSDCPKIIDAEGAALKNALTCGVDLVKPNLDELQRTLNVSIKNKKDALSACYRLIDGGAKRVLLSLGKHGAIITDGKKNYYCVSINVAMNSTLGAGDAMVAGAVDALLKGESDKNILRAGVATGTAAVTSPNSISFIKDKYQEILYGLTVEEI